MMMFLRGSVYRCAAVSAAVSACFWAAAEGAPQERAVAGRVTVDGHAEVVVREDSEESAEHAGVQRKLMRRSQVLDSGPEAAVLSPSSASSLREAASLSSSLAAGLRHRPLGGHQAEVAEATWRTLPAYSFVAEPFQTRVDALGGCRKQAMRLCLRQELVEVARQGGCAAGWLGDGAGWHRGPLNKGAGCQGGTLGYNDGKNPASAEPERFGAHCCVDRPMYKFLADPRGVDADRATFSSRAEAERACGRSGGMRLCSKTELQQVVPNGCHPGWLRDDAGWWRADLGDYMVGCGMQGFNKALPRYPGPLSAHCCREPGDISESVCPEGFQVDGRGLVYESSRLTAEPGGEKDVVALPGCAWQCRLRSGCIQFDFQRAAAPGSALPKCILYGEVQAEEVLSGERKASLLCRTAETTKLLMLKGPEGKGGMKRCDSKTSPGFVGWACGGSCWGDADELNTCEKLAQMLHSAGMKGCHCGTPLDSTDAGLIFDLLATGHASLKEAREPETHATWRLEGPGSLGTSNGVRVFDMDNAAMLDAGRLEEKSDPERAKHPAVAKELLVPDAYTICAWVKWSLGEQALLLTSRSARLQENVVYAPLARQALPGIQESIGWMGKDGFVAAVKRNADDKRTWTFICAAARTSGDDPKSIFYGGQVGGGLEELGVAPGAPPEGLRLDAVGDRSPVGKVAMVKMWSSMLTKAQLSIIFKHTAHLVLPPVQAFKSRGEKSCSGSLELDDAKELKADMREECMQRCIENSDCGGFFEMPLPSGKVRCRFFGGAVQLTDTDTEPGTCWEKKDPAEEALAGTAAAAASCVVKVTSTKHPTDNSPGNGAGTYFVFDVSEVEKALGRKMGTHEQLQIRNMRTDERKTAELWRHGGSGSAPDVGSGQLGYGRWKEDAHPDYWKVGDSFELLAGDCALHGQEPGDDNLTTEKIKKALIKKADYAIKAGESGKAGKYDDKAGKKDKYDSAKTGKAEGKNKEGYSGDKDKSGAKKNKEGKGDELSDGSPETQAYHDRLVKKTSKILSQMSSTKDAAKSSANPRRGSATLVSSLTGLFWLASCGWMATASQ
eukprot:TRINITY_DN27787_c0_g1_i1.p1 TRINITY_DN27787_c0_g1~~TRINITY_DN27787_c0_g1_i1.p1  ORF type:complete len:1068 (+),score=271.77 TRINITY_DN27787_c0_g1_i1:181-3384(+)